MVKFRILIGNIT